MQQQTVKLKWVTQNAEKLVVQMARVSNPSNENNENIEKLIKYCIKKQHWSIFEMCNLCVEIETSRVVSAQLIRHWSFRFQEFSQRYAPVVEILPIELRRQDKKNRQKSIDDLPEEVVKHFSGKIKELQKQTTDLYNEMLEADIAKESARMILPMASKTRLYMTGSIRSWIFYIATRTAEETQKEHRDVAEKCKAIFIEQFPIISKALGWTRDYCINVLKNMRQDTYDQTITTLSKVGYIDDFEELLLCQPCGERIDKIQVIILGAAYANNLSTDEKLEIVDRVRRRYIEAAFVEVKEAILDSLETIYDLTSDKEKQKLIISMIESFYDDIHPIISQQAKSIMMDIAYE
jgi:thymidylate synthase (FAD)